METDAFKIIIFKCSISVEMEHCAAAAYALALKKDMSIVRHGKVKHLFSVIHFGLLPFSICVQYLVHETRDMFLQIYHTTDLRLKVYFLGE